MIVVVQLLFITGLRPSSIGPCEPEYAKQGKVRLSLSYNPVKYSLILSFLCRVLLVSLYTFVPVPAFGTVHEAGRPATFKDWGCDTSPR